MSAELGPRRSVKSGLIWTDSCLGVSGLIGFDTSIAAVNVSLKRVRGLLAGLGLAISAVENDVDWFSGSALVTGNLKSLSRAFQLFERDSRSSFGLDDL